MATDAPVTLYVFYAGDPQTRFDRDYWLGPHFDLVREIWEPYGLQSVAGFFPQGDGAGLIAICPCVFADEQSLRAALAAPETKRVMDDVKHITDVEPQHSIGRAL